MSISAVAGPFHVFGQQPAGLGGVTNVDYNPDMATSLFAMGVGLLDTRYGYWDHPLAGGYRALGFGDDNVIPVVDQVPSALSATNIAGLQVPVAGTALTLAGASTGITLVATGGTQVFPSLLTVPANALILDGLPGIVATSTSGYNPNTVGVTGLYDPTTMLARNVRVTCAGDERLATFLVTGYDEYGFATTERITGVNTGLVASGKKAFKFIVSVVPAGTLSGSNVSVGTGDVYGMPLRVDRQFPYSLIWWNGSMVVATGNFVAADTTSPATSTTGDVRGTYAVPTASDGVKRFQVALTPSGVNSFTNVGLFGQNQA